LYSHIALASLTLSGAGAVYAEQQEAKGGLDEIVVTARKRTESLQDAPLAVVALSKDRIEKFDVTSLEKIAALSPQFFVGRSSNGSGAQMTLRGIGSSSTSIGIEQSVAVVMDGVYYGQGRVLNEGMFDLEQIELLKGPQSLFFGKNASAGVISLTTAKPTEQFEATAKIGHEFEAEQSRAELILSGPLSDKVGARLALRRSDMDGGYFSNQSQERTFIPYDIETEAAMASSVIPADNRDAPGEEETLARLTLTADISTNLQARLVVSHTDAEVTNSSWNYTAFNCPDGVGGLNADLQCGDNFVITQNRMPAPLANSLPHARSSGDLFNHYKSYAITATVDYQFDNFAATSITNYQDNSNTFGLSGDFQSIDNATFATERNTWKAFSEELRLASDFDGNINFMVGILYQESERKFDQWVATAGLANTAAPDPSLVYVASQKDSFTDGRTISPFAELTIAVAEDLELSLGARYTDEQKDSEFVHPYNNGGLGGIWRQGEVAIGDQDFTEFSPEATLTWQINNDVMGYVAYKTAYKSGGFSNSGIYSAEFMGGAASDFMFEPETVDGFEVGVKSTLLDNQLRLNVTAYSYTYDDLQVDFFNSPSFAFLTLNAGEATTEGLEIDAEYAPYSAPNLSLRGSLSLNNAEYDNFIAPCWAGQSEALGCDTIVTGTTSTPGQDLSGQSTAMAPELSGSLGLSYDSALTADIDYGFAVDAIYSDDYNASGFANPHAARDAYTTLDATFYLAGSDGAWELKLLGKNLTDEHIVSGVVDGPSTPVDPAASGAYADQMGFTSLPRTVALQLSYKIQ
jgi:outer membrane receptor protein involved in Fe transport